jgi:hypothetical protein
MKINETLQSPVPDHWCCYLWDEKWDPTFIKL